MIFVGTCSIAFCYVNIRRIKDSNPHRLITDGDRFQVCLLTASAILHKCIVGIEPTHGGFADRSLPTWLNAHIKICGRDTYEVILQASSLSPTVTLASFTVQRVHFVV